MTLYYYIPEKHEYIEKYGYSAGAQIWTLENLSEYLHDFEKNGHVEKFADQNGDAFTFNFDEGRVYVNGHELRNAYDARFCKNNARSYARVDFGYGKMYVAQYTLLLMCNDLKAYQKYAQDHPGDMIVVNHRNGCSFDNESENLEWSTDGLNAEHSGILKCILRYKPELTETLYTAGGVCKVALKKGLTVSKIEAFMDNYQLVYQRLRGIDKIDFFLAHA